ncbi:dTDP-4-dehydrorhamnose reductase [Roseateles terrae]|uniref:dTDP-4-dehydrorhamnose reductase n=1 Tax=Roseateles terrae TaxID=431060 RepID=A0ABR6GQS5_9BURK|nr:dTDP-4-dehydrorhamnose reductase [Roseateles terrae]MBB3194463.1 dTDP-4-dehydrorhamnose reductase [Roseateles terrae]OWQ88286.1 dTDP-4-dehydrorhamnose reductase [Roseateles terrae]
MKLLLLGKSGQLGWELQRALAPLGTLVSLDRTDGGDLSDSDALAATVRRVAPEVIVNAAAYTAVDKAESEEAAARQINATAVGVLAAEARALGALLVHYSTDYVFDGSGDQARDESAATGPLSAYGRTKLEGERLIAEHGADALVLRTSWVYAARGGNFAKTMLRLAAEREQLKVVADQIGAPTGADLLADVTAHLVRSATADRSLCGVYHAVASGATSWHQYAQHVLRRAAAKGVTLKVQAEQVEAIPTSAYPVPAPRPLNSRLDNRALQSRFGLVMPHWQTGVDRMLDEIL